MILIAGQLEGLTTRKDKTIRLTFGSQELSPKEFAEIFAMNQQFCYIGIKPEPFSKIESDSIESLKTEYDDMKSPGQRLRAILYRNHEQEPEGFKTFAEYYLFKMDKLCEHFKTKLL